MENKIVRQCVQGLINDSKLIDELCDLLETERHNLVKVVTDLDKEKAYDTITRKDLVQIKNDIIDATRQVQDAQGSADYANDEARNAYDYAQDAEYKLDELRSSVTEMLDKLPEEEIEQSQYQEAEEAQEVTEEQKEINNSNQYETINN